MTWKDVVEELNKRKKLAYQMGGEKNVKRQQEQGKLTARERIEALLDPGSFMERGVLAGESTYEKNKIVSFTPCPILIGSGTLGSHLAAFFAGCGCDVALFGRKGGATRAKARLPKLSASCGQASTQAGSFPSSNRGWHIVHFITLGASGSLYSYVGTSKGHARRQYRQPTHTDGSYTTAPSGVLVNAATKQAEAHAGSLQWLHCCLRNTGDPPSPPSY